MDLSLQILKRAYEIDTTEQNYRAYAKALRRSGKLLYLVRRPRNYGFPTAATFYTLQVVKTVEEGDIVVGEQVPYVRGQTRLILMNPQKDPLGIIVDNKEGCRIVVEPNIKAGPYPVD